MWYRHTAALYPSTKMILVMYYQWVKHFIFSWYIKKEKGQLWINVQKYDQYLLFRPFKKHDKNVFADLQVMKEHVFSNFSLLVICVNTNIDLQKLKASILWKSLNYLEKIHCCFYKLNLRLQKQSANLGIK